MYTKNEAISKLGVSRATLYKHMEKNGIEKGIKLNDEHIKVLKNSISKTKKDNTIQTLEKEYIYKINELENKVNEMKETILKLEIDNRELVKQIQTSQILVNEAQTKNQELVASNQKLLELKAKKKKFWQK